MTKRQLAHTTEIINALAERTAGARAFAFNLMAQGPDAMLAYGRKCEADVIRRIEEARARLAAR